MSYRHEFNENTGSDEPATNENVLVLAVGAQTTEVFTFTLLKPKMLVTHSSCLITIKNYIYPLFL